MLTKLLLLSLAAAVIGVAVISRKEGERCDEHFRCVDPLLCEITQYFYHEKPVPRCVHDARKNWIVTRKLNESCTILQWCVYPLACRDIGVEHPDGSPFTCVEESRKYNERPWLRQLGETCSSYQWCDQGLKCEPSNDQWKRCVRQTRNICGCVSVERHKKLTTPRFETALSQCYRKHAHEL
ncbi:unnamed protein product [Caenorhabditis auriculariae]|uniref:Uncharacterized protein n=1 Tax=Caenorhabditis auriculariae TaxID=2777116 RepID=A0A8S1H276_9PELO|nr:unnamed protein product [Caenorhabditis auriculariae]